MELGRNGEGLPHLNAHFGTTHWSVVLTAAQSDWERAAESLAVLCQTYWYPIYAYMRRMGHEVEDAQDLTQEFFARMLEKRYLASADPEKGRFRCFLLTAVKRFLANEWDWEHRIKRGGHCEHFSWESISMNEETAEARFQTFQADRVSPVKDFERRWAITLLDQVLARLEKEFVEKQREEFFVDLKQFLTGEEERGAYVEAARRLAMTEGSLRVAVHRMRQRYRELLRLEIAQTVGHPDDIDEEIRCLFAALSC